MPPALRPSRRQFLQTTAVAALSGGVGFARQPPAEDRARETSPLEQLRVAVVGTGIRGKQLIGNLPPNVRVVAICDCHEGRMAGTLQPAGEQAEMLSSFAATDAARCATYVDYRKLFAAERLDAVLIATPDHHHVPAAMHALAAGLDVYLEKPLTLTIREGRTLVDAVQKTGRVLQVGSQQRTMEINLFACEYLRNGNLGRVTHVDMPNYPGPLPMPTVDGTPPAAGLDWDLFCGPAPLAPHDERLWRKDEFKVGEMSWRGWDLYRDYSGHMMTNWGAHSIDMVQLALGRDDTGPVEFSVRPSAALDGYAQQWKRFTPAPTGGDERRFWPVTARYADGVEIRFVNDADFALFHGERGTLKMRRNFFEIAGPRGPVPQPDPQVLEKWKGAGHVARPHLENWIECIRTRGTPNAPIEVGHRTVTICHLANLARELNRTLRWNPATERFVDDPAADALLDRPRRAGFELPVI